MPDGRASSICGQCPTCGKLVTLPPAARDLRVACPVCSHQARGADFAPREPPLPVLVLSSSSEPDEPRTHLLLSPEDVTEEAPEGDWSLDTGEPQTRLMHPPLTGGAPRALVRSKRLGSRLLAGGERLEAALHGRWLESLGALACICGALAPVADHVFTDGRSTLHVFTFVSVSAGFGALLLARANALGSEAGQWAFSTVVARVRAQARLLFESFERFGEGPRHLRLALAGQALAAVGIAGLLWAGVLAAVRLAFASKAPPTSLPFVCGLILAGGLVLLWHAARSAPPRRFSLEQTGNALAAAAELPPVVDLSRPLPESIAKGSTLLHQVLVALSDYRSRPWPDEASYRAALARHLELRLPTSRIERERWIGRSRREGVLDLVVDGIVMIGVGRGFDEASATRTLSRMNACARTWSGKPLMLALFETPEPALATGEHAAALRQLHARAALLTLRMPEPA